MMRDAAYEVFFTDKPTYRWATRIMTLWAKDGYPVLIGAPAEQVQLAKRILGID